MSTTITDSDLRANLSTEMDRVCDSRKPLVVTRQNGSSVVMLSLEDYESLNETAYLLRSSKNARRLLQSIHEIESQGGTKRESLD